MKEWHREGGFRMGGRDFQNAAEFVSFMHKAKEVPEQVYISLVGYTAREIDLGSIAELTRILTDHKNSPSSVWIGFDGTGLKKEKVIEYIAAMLKVGVKSKKLYLHLSMGSNAF